VLPFVEGASLRRSSLLTCLAHGVPVVTSQVAPLPELRSSALVAPFEQPRDFRLDESVLCSPVGDDAVLARTIFRALNDPGQLKRAIVEGDALASRLDWSLVATATERVYAKVVDTTH
jgi:glycosyltransferase involved in cell wall biosynthesis